MNYSPNEYVDDNENSNREYVSKERFKKTLSIKPTRKLFSLIKNINVHINVPKKQEEDQYEPEIETLKLSWIKLEADETKNTLCSSDYPLLTLDKIEEKIIISNEKGWKKIEKKHIKVENIPDEINYALSMLSSEKFIIFEGAKHYGLLLNNHKSCNEKDIKYKTEYKNYQEKTQMCRMNKEKKCRNGNNCRFAHSLSELVVNPCNFGEKCKCVRFQKDKYINSGDKICIYRHPGENRNDYYKRNNL